MARSYRISPVLSRAKPGSPGTFSSPRSAGWVGRSPYRNQAFGKILSKKETQRNHLSMPVHLVSIRASPYSTGVHYPVNPENWMPPAPFLFSWLIKIFLLFSLMMPVVGTCNIEVFTRSHGIVMMISIAELTDNTIGYRFWYWRFQISVCPRPG